MTGIYKITNPEGKIYIGQSVNVNLRKNAYNSKGAPGQIKLDASIKKYGFKAHTFTFLEKCSTDELNERERFYQEKFNAVYEGLNCVLVKTSEKKYEHCLETREKMSKSHLGKKQSEETKRKIGDSNKKPIYDVITGQQWDSINAYRNEFNYGRYQVTKDFKRGKIAFVEL